MSTISGTVSVFTVSRSNNISKFQISAKRLINFREEFDCRASVSRHRAASLWVSRRSTMESSRGIAASTKDDGIHSFEQEALVEETLGFGGGGGVEATMNNLSKWITLVFFAALILWKHDAESLWTTMGAVLNTGLSVILKIILNQERPIPTSRPDPGMPSSHAQSIFYMTTYFNLLLVASFGMNAVTGILSTIFFIVGSYFITCYGKARESGDLLQKIGDFISDYISNLPKYYAVLTYFVAHVCSHG
ncbi:lipid phosphate phosphatase epsilon 1, chloroplastic isoform X2 [Andrographis paniculata]|uniref:lipid phosphate phosphatase epsilon 1, chloroplastic isoform X2 n=1 Tax=Andrographis paniculata TaxID=175694 RepID=UPI0021E82FDD|nr:lipid phosphate phosphatase epsilon 1, chloroplastic isoform X2 [Andrographis paniculata]